MSEYYEVEHNIPIPPKGRGFYKPRSPLRIALESMNVGDSILVPCIVNRKLRNHLQVVNTTGWKVAKKQNKKFVTRIEGNGVRTWRVL